MHDDWSVQINDLVGGFIVTTYPYPLSQHDLRPNGDPTKGGKIACECSNAIWAGIIAGLLNTNEYIGE